MWWQVLLPFVGTALGYAARYAIGETRWRAVRSLALRLLADDKKPEVDTANQAVIEALITLQLEKLVTETDKVRRAFDLTANGVAKRATGAMKPLGKDGER